MTGDAQDPRVDRQGKMGGFKVSGTHVDPHQDGAYRVAKAHSRNAGVPEAKIFLSIMLCVDWYVQELPMTTSGYPKAQLPSKKKK